MEYKKLGQTDIKVSKICLGTMTWGEQNTQAEAYLQLDYSLQQGVNFIDTAELYAVPPKKETCNTTEIMLGNWLSQSKRRSEVVLASKMAGRGLEWIRGGAGLFVKDIEEAIEGSLKRLQTDYIDLYQLHWPQRSVALWGKLNYQESGFFGEDRERLEEFYLALDKFVKQGKIRHIGLSNETAWGLMEYQRLAKAHSLTPMVSIQNAYSLIRREYEVALSEISLFEKIGLLAYSPLAGGLLSGKYRNGAMPADGRYSLFPATMGYYFTPRSFAAVEAYQNLADELGISLTSLSLAFVNDRSFVTSNIIGATSIEQLAENIASAEISLSAETLEKIDAIFSDYPNPANF